MQTTRLTRHGGDRATAYAMSNKILMLPAGLLCTWIDAQRQNQWALLDPDSGRQRARGSLGYPCPDNHCGAALALAPDGLHAVTGGHHSPLEHVHAPVNDPGNWQHRATIEVHGTYPALVAGEHSGVLHLAFRCPGPRFMLQTCRYRNARWSAPRTLIVADRPGYIYWTNTLATGTDDTLHLIAGNTRVRPDGGLLYAASHLRSLDDGFTWLDDQERPLPPNAAATAIPLLTGTDTINRIQPADTQEATSGPGPHNFNYQQLLLSNAVAGPDAAVYVILHNNLTGSVDLIQWHNGKWRSRDLTATALAGRAGCRIHPQSSLARTADGRLFAALMIEPTDSCVWGPPGTWITCLEVAGFDGPIRRLDIMQPESAYAQWLPAFPHQTLPVGTCMPPMLFTHGVNAGGFDQNANTIETEVRLIHATTIPVPVPTSLITDYP